MIHKSSLALFSGLLVLLFGAMPSLALGQESESSVAQNLAAAKALSAASGRPILAVAGSAT